MGEFTGFTFGEGNNCHSSSLGITRVSGGDRYSEELHPEIKDKTAEVPGLNGEYYFGSDYGPRSFNIEIAYDSMTEEQFKRMRQFFGTRDIRKLIFDERPYKYYLAKIENPIELSYICFDEPNYTWQKIRSHYDDQTGQIVYVKGIKDDFERKVYDGTTRRIYKGEGTINFICHFPFAKSAYKQIPSGQEEEDWVISSGILSSSEYNERHIDTWVNNVIKVYNPGDLETGFRLYLPNGVINNANGTEIIYKFDNVVQTAALNLEQIELKSGDIGVLVDSNNGLITGVSNMSITQDGNATYTTSGNLYNQHIISGYLFKLEANVSGENSTIQIANGNENIKIFYDYLYF